MAEAVVESQQRAAKDLIPPRFILNLTIDQMRRFVVDAAGAESVRDVARRARRRDQGARAGGSRRRSSRRPSASSARASTPNGTEAIAFLETLVPRSADRAGLWRLEGGAEAYAYFLKNFTTTDLTADQIHEIGLRKVAELERDMDALLRKLGRSTGTVKERVEQLKKDLSYPITEDGRKQIMADIDAMIREAERRSALQFDTRPKGPVIAQPYPRFREANAAASYTPPPLDGSRPAIFQMPLRPDQMTKFGLRTLVHHETVPGHHFQIGLMVENHVAAEIQAGAAVRRHLRDHGRMGALRGAAGGRIGLVRGRSRRAARADGQGAVARAPPRRRHGPARQAVDARAGDRLRHRSERDRAIRRVSGPGVLVHDRPAEDSRAARPREGAD